MDIEILKPFGPSIVKLKLPESIINEMNNYTDNVVNDAKKLNQLNWGDQLVGNVHQEFRLNVEFMQKIKWAEFLAEACQEWILNERKATLKGFKIINSWIVRQFKNEYNPLHYHGGHISGVGYLKVPENLGDTIQKNKSEEKNNNGKLELVEGSRKLFCRANYLITPQVGDFYLFPHYLLHSVYPFTNSEDERRSVSFNATIESDSFSDL